MLRDTQSPSGNSWMKATIHVCRVGGFPLPSVVCRPVARAVGGAGGGAVWTGGQALMIEWCSSTC